MKKRLAGAMLAVGIAMFAQNPDNTKANKKDHESGAATADQQSNSKHDVDVTREIRKQVVADTSMSTYAKNVKIITKGGMVTLKGPVRSTEEKDKVEMIAKQVAGNDHVKSEIEVAAK